MKREQQIQTAEQTAMRVSAVSIVGNIILSLFKLMAGILAHSGAMISDAVHSASDVFSSIVVIIGVKLSAKASDKEHPYGHERMECVAAILLATILAATGLFIGWSKILCPAIINRWRFRVFWQRLQPLFRLYSKRRCISTRAGMQRRLILRH